MDSLLNFPQYYTLRDVFLNNKDMTEIQKFVKSWELNIGAENVQFMGNFNDNHDQPRFLSEAIHADPDAMHLFTEDPFYVYDENRLKQFKSFTAYQLVSGTNH